VPTGPREEESDPETESPWEQMIADMNTMAANREEVGYEVITLPASDTTPKPPSSGESDEWGLSYVLASNFADRFSRGFPNTTFTETGVYWADADGNRYVVTECLDHDNSLALFVAGAFQLQFAAPLVETAVDREKMHTHLKKLDGTHLGSIEHDDAEMFFPNPAAIYAYAAGV
jgi:hypothetical protein